MNHSVSGEKKGRIFGNLPKNIVSMGWASLFTDVSSEILYPLLPIFLTSISGLGSAIGHPDRSFQRSHLSASRKFGRIPQKRGTLRKRK
jgi:hypothetical protein